ncbi:thioredoxin family protein [Polaribacter sp. R77954]|uniref:thioredoxin family protein n=1 Tax=Polaribacter sp. R77954 TaxID=3093870 RepID=UPI0037C6B12B
MNHSENTSNNVPKVVKRKSHPFWQFFWLTFLVVSLGYAWYSFYTPSNDISWIDNIESAQKLAVKSDKNTMIFFTGTWCSPCKIMKREVFADNEVKKAIDTNVISVEINIDDPKSEKLVKQCNISATPTTIFMNPQGKVMDYAVGKVGKSKLLEMLEKQK